MGKKTILWIEERQETLEDEIIFCKNKGLEVKIKTTPASAKQFLLENTDKILFIVVDLMLFGVLNLDSIGIKDAPTSLGYNAGWVFIERYLRHPVKGKNYFHIPLLILSSKKLLKEGEERLKKLKSRGGAPIEYIEKGSIENSNMVSDIKFQEYVKKILLKEKG